MKKCCLNCMFAKPLTEDLDVLDDLNDGNDFLICLNSFNIITATNLNKASGERIKVEAFIVDDDNLCALYKPCKGREDDLRVGC